LFQIFFRAGTLSQLEDQRDERVAARITQLQAQCRGFLARKRLVKIKVLLVEINKRIQFI
jgi:myosin-18